ncbi:hypothetical protein BG003_003596 [Podila horticola]|nr:hypothetical protein BG003_003596 [Podila horticola]
MRPSPIDTTPSTTPTPTTTTTTKPRPAAKPTSSSTSSSSTNNDLHTPSLTQPSPSHSHNRTYSAVTTKLRSLPYKKIALYLRLLILALAFVTLILDAITVSFEVNVMNVDLSEVAAQAAFLFSPDVLAMILFLVLLIYPMRYCFSRQYDTPGEDMPLDEEQDVQANVSETSLGPNTRSRREEATEAPEATEATEATEAAQTSVKTVIMNQGVHGNRGSKGLSNHTENKNNKA